MENVGISHKLEQWTISGTNSSIHISLETVISGWQQRKKCDFCGEEEDLLEHWTKIWMLKSTDLTIDDILVDRYEKEVIAGVLAKIRTQDS